MKISMPPQSEFVPASAWATMKCVCLNAMSIAPHSQPYIEYNKKINPHLAYFKTNIQNKVSFEAYFICIAGNVSDRSVF